MNVLVTCKYEEDPIKNEGSAETDVYLCVLNHGHLTLISMRFIP